MDIKINRLNITNFKGVESLCIDFNEFVTHIYGDNATGKTSIMDAFLWLVHGKDSSDRKEFNIKNTVKTNLNRQDHEVEGIFTVDGQPLRLKHVFREKWQKKSGETEPKMVGNEHLYFWNEVPVREKDWIDKIRSTFCNEDVFKLVTNSGYFTSLSWKNQRGILMDMAGSVSDSDLAKGNKDFEALLRELIGKDLDEYLIQVTAEKNKIKKELVLIPARIAEATHNRPEEKDWAAIKSELNAKQTRLREVNNVLKDTSLLYEQEVNKNTEIRKRISQLQNKVENIKSQTEWEIHNKKRKQQDELSNIQRRIDELQFKIRSLSSQRDILNSEINDFIIKVEEVRNKWKIHNSETPDINKIENSFYLPEAYQCICDDCKEMLASMDRESRVQGYIESFNISKAELLKNLVNEANMYKSNIASKSDKITEINKTIEDINLEIASLNDNLTKISDKDWDSSAPTIEEILSKNEDYNAAIKEIDKLTDKVKELNQIDNSEIEAEKEYLESSINQLSSELSIKDIIDRHNARISELKNQEQYLSQQVADYEKKEFTIKSFTKHKLDSISATINNMFSLVEFKLFDYQINGGLIETCEVMYNGVPYSVLNNAARINAGLDIINTLSKHYNVTAPVFVDNAESVTKLIGTNGQLVKLIVSEGVKTIKVA